MLNLLDQFHNLILSLVRGPEGVCFCTCGRNQDYQVLPYYEGHLVLNSRETYNVSAIVTKQDVDFVVGVVVGLFINWFTLHLQRVWNESYRSQWQRQMIEMSSWTLIQKYSIFKTIFTRLFPYTQNRESELTDEPVFIGHHQLT